MNNLMITLPTLNKEWIEHHRYDLENQAFDEFDMMSSVGWAEELDSHDFEEKYDRVSSHEDIKNWHSNYKDNYVHHKVPEYAERVFKEKGIWKKRICTEKLIDTYHGALYDITHWLAFNVALSWARALGCDVKDDRGVIPYKKDK